MGSDTLDPYAQGKRDLEARDFAQAEAEFAQAEAANPGATNALALRAKALIHLNRFPEAEHCLRSYLEKNPQSEDAHYLLGYVLFRRNLAKESLAAYTDAARLHRPSADDLKIVALDYVLLDDYPDAIKWLQRAMQEDAGNAEVAYHLARLYYLQNSFDTSIELFQRALRLDPGFAKAEDNLGLAYAAKNQVELAETAYRRAIQMQEAAHKPFEDPFINLADLIGHEGKHSEALTLLDRAEQIGGKSERTRKLRGWIYFSSGKPAQAEPELRAALSSSPRNGSLHYLLARVLKQQGKETEAESEFMTARKLLGDHSPSPNDIGR